MENNPSTTTQGDAELLPCRRCGAECRVEGFSNEVVEPTIIWLCSKHKWFGGDCPSETAYLSEEAWNTRSLSTSPIAEQTEQYVALVIEQELYRLLGIMDFDATPIARALATTIPQEGPSEATQQLDRLLRMTVPVPPGCVAPEGTPMSPEFRVSVQLITDDGVRFIIHAHGHSSDTLDLVTTVRGLALLAPFKPGESQSERIARTAALAQEGQEPSEAVTAAMIEAGELAEMEWQRQGGHRVAGSHVAAVYLAMRSAASQGSGE